MGLVAMLLLLELVFRLLPVSTATRSGYYIHPLILTYPAHHCFTAATGWDLKNTQHNCANNFGFLADRDFAYDPKAIALIGDSFVEANMLPAKERLGAQLESRLAGRPVYALGGAGSSLLDYAERAKFAAKMFGSRTFVFILSRADVREAICSSGNIHGPCIDAKTLSARVETQPAPSIFKRVIRESALAQYLFSQLKLDISRILGRFRQPEPAASTGVALSLPSSASHQVIAEFFKRLSSIENGRFLFLIDPDRAHLSATSVTDGDDLQSLTKAAHAINARVIDPTSSFREFVSRSGRALEIGPYDKHWNKNAVQILSGIIAQELAGLDR